MNEYLKNLEIPANLPEMLQKGEIWEDDSLSPFYLSIIPATYKGKDTTCYQVEFSPADADEDNDLDGDEWEQMLREHIRLLDPSLETRIIGDSESETCVLWTDNESDFRKMLGYLISFSGKAD